MNTTNEIIFKVLSQLKENKLFLSSIDTDYCEGINTTYHFSEEKNSYIVALMDTVASTFFKESILSEQEIKARIQNFSVLQLRNQGFVV